jgi:hypothetical protein
VSVEDLIERASRANCLVIDSRGYQCTAVPMTGLRIPLCKHHAAQVLRSFGFSMPEKGIKDEAQRRADEDVRRRRWSDHLDRRAEHRAALLEASVVYYVAIGDHIKIGYSSNVKRRLSQLRVEADALLAIEPGGHDVEAKRHRQFRADRIHARREDFRLSDALRQHIAEMVAEHGAPKLVMPPRTSPVIEIRQADSA